MASDLNVGVGSIAHILKTAFKNVYDDDEVQRNEIIAREARKVKAAKQAERQIELDAIAEAEAAERTKLDAKKVRKLSVPKSSIASINLEVEPTAEKNSSPNELIDEFQVGLKLDKEQQNLLQQKLQLIEERFRDETNDANNLNAYLSEQKQSALNAEKIVEDDLKRQGILVGQHIPSLPSKLDINMSVISQFGLYGSDLYHAGELVDANRKNCLRRTGNLPISDTAEDRKAQRKKEKNSHTENVSSFLSKTAAMESRESVVKVRFSESLNDRANKRIQDKLVEKESDEIMIGTKKASTRNLKGVLTAIEKNLNDEIQESMKLKLQYVRNPHNNPGNVKNLLTKSNAYKEFENGHTVKYKNNKIRDDKNYFGVSKNTKNQLFPLFVAEPPVIEFLEFAVGDVLKVSLSLRNISTISRTLSIIPPGGGRFSMTPLLYPSVLHIEIHRTLLISDQEEMNRTKHPQRNIITCSVAGAVAAGMNVRTDIFFHPDSLGDISDFITVATEGGDFRIPLLAKRNPPQLNIPSTIDIGTCLVGDATQRVITCTNSGGNGRFKLYSAESYEDNVEDTWKETGCIRTPPFTIYPSLFTLNQGDSVDLIIEYVPLSLGSHTGELYMVCDNLQIRLFDIKASSRQVDISVVEINNTRYDRNITDLESDLYFSAVTVQTEKTQHIVICNDTGIPVEYEWIWLSDKVKDKNKSNAAIEILRINESGRVDTHTALFGADGAKSRRSSDVINCSDDVCKYVRGKSRGDLLQPRTCSKDNIGLQNERLINSVMKSLEASLTSENNTSMGDFTLSPARGVFPGEGSETFSITFSPQSLEESSFRAVLMLKNIPQGSYPDTQQHAELKKLSLKGHGLFPRLLFQMDTMTDIVEVSSKALRVNSQANDCPYEEPVQDFSTQGLTFQDLLDLLESHEYGTESGDGEGAAELLKLHLRMKALVAYVLLFRTNDLLLTETTGYSEANSSDIDGRDEDKDRDGMIRKRREDDNRYHENNKRSDGNDEDDDDELNYMEKNSNSSRIRIFSWNGNKDLVVSLLPSLPMCPNYYDDREQDFDEIFNEEEKDTLSQIFLDMKSATNLLGFKICHYLNESINHEAIDYLHDISLKNVLCVDFLVCGDARPQVLELGPKILSIGGYMSVGKTYKGTVTIYNPSTAMSEISILTEGLLAVRRLSSSVPLTDAERSMFTVETVPSGRILLMSDMGATIDVLVTSALVGEFAVTLPLVPSCPHAYIDNLTIMIRIVGPRFRFDIPEIDFGLVGVGETMKKVLLFTNEGDVPARYLFTSILQQDGEGVQQITFKKKRRSSEASSILSRGLGRSNSLKSLGRGDETSRSTATDATNDSFRISGSKTAVVTIDQPFGILEPQCTASAYVTCSAGSHPQRLRGLIECKLVCGESSQVALTQAVSFRAEIQSPKTLIYPMSIRLGEIYTGVPVNFTVTLQNICNLPTKFKFERPGGPSPNYQISFKPSKGDLGPKEVKKIKVEIISDVCGKIEDVLACKLFGVSGVLGFSLSAQAKGLSVEFSKFQSGSRVPVPLANKSAVQYSPLGDCCPDPGPIPTLEFTNNGMPVPLYERRELKFFIRNFSAIQTSFNIFARAFGSESDTKNSERMLRKETEDLNSYTSNSVSLGSRKEGGVTFTQSVLLHEKRQRSLRKETDRKEREKKGMALGGREGKKKDMGEAYLVPHEDGINKFYSKAGKEFLSTRIEQEDNLKFLKSGLGCCYILEPRCGVLPPWGVVEVTVKAYNDMPGKYDDVIICKLRTMPDNVQTEHILPLKMFVRGCPFVIVETSLGMSYGPRTVEKDEKSDGGLKEGKEDSDGGGIRNDINSENSANIDDNNESDCNENSNNENVNDDNINNRSISNMKSSLRGSKHSRGRPLLLMGHACTNAPLPTRALQIKNQGSKVGIITWTCTAAFPDRKRNRRLKLDFNVQEGGKVKVKLPFWEDVIKETHFKIEPSSSSIAPYGSQTFIVTLLNTDTVGLHRGLLTGCVSCNVEDIENGTAHTRIGLDEDSTYSTYSLSLDVTAELFHPSIRMDKHLLVADSITSPTQLHADQGIKMKTQALLLFKQDRDSVNDACWKSVTLTNPLQATLVFSVSTEGPFLLKAQGPLGGYSVDDLDAINQKKDSDNTPKIKNKNSELNDNTDKRKKATSKYSTNLKTKMSMSLTDADSDSGMSTQDTYNGAPNSIGRIFSLSSKQSASFLIAFTPRKELRQTLKKVQPASSGLDKPTIEKGQLLVSFSTGQALRIPIAAEIALPFLTASSPGMFFNVCQVSKECEGFFLLQNPTEVPAKWSYIHESVDPSSKKISAIRVAGYNERGPEIDDPSVFEISPGSGFLFGPTLSAPSAMGAPAKDFNRDARPIVDQKLSECSFLRTSTSGTLALSFKDTLQQRNDASVLPVQSAANAKYPAPITVKFKPRKNIRYKSRFRFVCEFGNSFDVIMQGEGTYEEHEHNPNSPYPK